MYNVGVYLKKRYDEGVWQRKMDEYNTKYMKPPCNSQEMVKTIAS